MKFEREVKFTAVGKYTGRVYVVDSDGYSLEMAFIEGWQSPEVKRAIRDSRNKVPVCGINGVRCRFVGCGRNSESLKPSY